jgi:hypothetical protein
MENKRQSILSNSNSERNRNRIGKDFEYVDVILHHSTNNID